MTGVLKRLTLRASLTRTALAAAALAFGLWTASSLWAVDSSTEPAPKPPATKPATTKPATTKPSTPKPKPASTPPAAPLTAAVALTTEPRPDVVKLPEPNNDPKTVSDLKAIQARIEAVAKIALPAVVSIQFPNEQGSGVLVSKEGYILTAGHVSGTPGVHMRIVLADGRHLWGVALGADNGIDSGMIKIVEPGTYPFVPVGSARKLVAGQWVVALGHPGGYVRGRPPVVRLGRVLLATPFAIETDSPLISGDSGGPLFDLDGKLIGINSRIGQDTKENIHVPIDTFIANWTRLAKGDQWNENTLFRGMRGAPVGGATLGIHANTTKKDAAVQGAVVQYFHKNSPAEKAGLHADDIITMFNGKLIKSDDDLADAVSKKKPGESVRILLLRDGKEVELNVTLGDKAER